MEEFDVVRENEGSGGVEMEYISRGDTESDFIEEVTVTQTI